MIFKARVREHLRIDLSLRVNQGCDPGSFFPA